MCHLPLLSLAQTWVPGFPPTSNNYQNQAASVSARLWQGQHQGLAGSLSRGLPDPLPATLELRSYEALLRLCVQVRACLYAPDPLLGPIQAPSLGRLSGFQSLSCNQENGVFKTTVGWILQVLPAVSAFEGQDGFGRARWSHHCQGLSIYVKNKKKNKEKKIHRMNPSLNSPPLSPNP